MNKYKTLRGKNWESGDGDSAKEAYSSKQCRSTLLSWQMIACPTKTHGVSQETGDYVNAYSSNINPSYSLCALPKVIASYF